MHLLVIYLQSLEEHSIRERHVLQKTDELTNNFTKTPKIQVHEQLAPHHIDLPTEKWVVSNIFLNEEIKIECPSESDSDCANLSPLHGVEFIKIEPLSPIPESNIAEIELDESTNQRSSESKKWSRSKNTMKSRVNRYECDFCGKFLTKSTLWRHRIVVHKVRGEKCCNTCAKVFPTEEELTIHRMDCLLKRKNRLYNKPGKFECDICKAVLTTKSSLLTHMKYKHIPNGKPYECKLCNAKYIGRSSLQQHLDLKHFNVRNFMCSTCGKSFKTKTELEIHMIRHTDEKPVECPFTGCTRRFTSINNRDTHMRTHTGEKPFKCTADLCGRQFKYIIDFKRHKFKAHGIFTKMFPCTICDQVLPENSMLRKHMRTHYV